MPPDPIRETSHALIDAARADGLYADSKDVLGTRYSIRTGESEVRLVVRQSAVCSDRRPDDRQIADDLARRGLNPEGRYAFANDFVSVFRRAEDVAPYRR